MHTFSHMLRLAWADYRHEKLLSLCAVLALAAVITPLLILYGVKFGVVHTLVERMRSNPLTLAINPVASGNYTLADMEELRRNPAVAFVLPLTRSISATMNLSTIPPDGSTNRKVVKGVSLTPTAEGDPLLLRYGATIPVLEKSEKAARATDPGEQAVPARSRLRPSDATLRLAGVVLSESCARKLGVGEGDMVIGRVERVRDGIISGARIKLCVRGILPPAAEQKPTAYIPPTLLDATEDFRDGFAVPDLGEENGWTGDPFPEGTRRYAGFRLYAASLEDVTVLRDEFAKKGIDTYTQAEAIEQVMTLDRGLNAIFTLICSVAGAGFFLATTSNVFAGIRRKARTLGLLQLAGFSTGSIMVFPLAQVTLTALFGSGLASCVYFGIGACINQYFGQSLQGVEQICTLLPEHFAIAFALVTGISLLAALGPAWHSTRIEPSEVIRDV